MPTIQIGSQAMRVLGVGNRTPKDCDYFSDELAQRKGFDVFWHADLYGYFGHNRVARAATLDELYTIKVSHSYWELPNGSWDKHILDVMALKEAGAQLIPELHKTLYAIWEQKHGKKQMDLSKEADKFFKDAVKRTYDHDSIHVSVAYGERPMYESILKDGHTVDIDPKKMWALGRSDLVRLFREEVYATALERILIPTNYAVSPSAAYWWALRRTVTSLTKGRSARFIVENFREFLYPQGYLDRHMRKRDKLIRLETTQ